MSTLLSLILVFATELSAPAALVAPTGAAPASVPAEPDAPAGIGRFHFGSFGRFGVFTNQLGREVQAVNAVSRIPRLEKRPYLELAFAYERTLPFARMQVQLTPAIAGDPFHYSGRFLAEVGLRNAYLEFDELGALGLYAWGGSRMYRGDDIVLLDFWPLDDQNTLGGGLGWRKSLGDYHGFDVGLHAGAGRVLGANFFNQQILVADRDFGATEITTNNRQRLIGSLKASYSFPIGPVLAFKLKLYGEAHSIASGALELKGQISQVLPGDGGYVLGGQVSVFQQRKRNYLHLFLRQGQNLGAYPSLAVPFGLNQKNTTEGAHETLVGVAADAFFFERVGVMFGGYYRSFGNARPDVFDNEDVDELIGVMRVNISPWKYFQQALELSLQRSYPHGLQSDVLRQVSPAILKFSLMPTLVSGPLNLPDLNLRLIYTYTKTNEDTRYLFAPQDPRAGTRDFHFFGIQAEWMFDYAI